MLNKKIPILLVLLCTVAAYMCHAQAPETRIGSTESTDEEKTIDPRLNEKGDRLLNTQAEIVLQQVNETLARFQPQYPEPAERRLAFSLLDCIFHDVYAPARPPVHEFIHTRMQKMVQELENTNVKDGAKIWKLYNQGFIVRTNTVTMAFDVIRYSNRFENFSFDVEPVLARIADQCDVLFLSHSHSDHSDEWVAQQFISRGKPVIAPPDFWQEKEIYKQMTHLERNADVLQSLPVQNGAVELKVLNYPGHQFQLLRNHELLNNVYLVFTPEDISFSHPGDQNQKTDYAGTKKVGEKYKVDVHFYKIASPELVPQFKPDLLIASHENELGHGVHHRFPYWRYRSWSERTGYPLIIMAWGESLHYVPEK